MNFQLDNYAHPKIRLSFENTFDNMQPDHYMSVYLLDENEPLNVRREMHYNYLIYGDSL